MPFRLMRSTAFFAAVVLPLGCAAAAPSLQYATTGYVPAPAPAGAFPTLQGSTHTVRPGETLWRIARSYGLDARLLASANRLPENRTVAVGQKLYIPLPPETDHFLWPVLGSNTPSHSGGIDIYAGPESLVRASRSGRVAVATARLMGWGNAIVMDHADGSTTVYAGLEQLVVPPGALLRQGMPLGLTGQQPVHFEIRNGVKPANTLALLPRE